MIIIPKSRIITKRTGDAWTVAADFVDLLATGDTVSSCTVAAEDATFKTDYSTGGTAVIASTTATIATPLASVGLQNGVEGRNYRLTFTATTTNSDTLIIEALLRVR